MSLLAHFASEGALDLVAHDGLSPENVKSNLISLLAPYFQRPAILEKFAVALAPEAVNLRSIEKDTVAKELYAKVETEYRRAARLEPSACYMYCRDWEQKVHRGVAEYWSALNLAVDLNALNLRDYKFEMFRLIGLLIEAIMQPCLRELLQLARIAGHSQRHEGVRHLDLGRVIDELINDYDYKASLSPKPWNLKLNQWRNMAQHFSTRVEGCNIIGVYGKGKGIRELRLNRQELFAATKEIHSIARALKTARTIFIVDNIDRIGLDAEKIELREEQKLLHLESSFATQGFALASIQITDEGAGITVRDLTGSPSRGRMVHATQFVYPLWREFPRPIVRVTYRDSGDTVLLTATVTGDDCEQVATGKAPFKSLAEKAHFDLSDAGRTALE